MRLDSGMEFVQTETTLVIAGAWNPAILTPEWVGVHGLGLTPPINVRMWLSTTDALTVHLPKFSIDNFEYSAAPHMLQAFVPDMTTEAFAHAEATVAKLLDTLKHTPVNGVGHNFKMTSTSLDHERLAMFDRANEDISGNMPEQFGVTRTRIETAIKTDNERVVLNLAREIDTGVLTAIFNFHHTIDGAENAIKVLRGEDGYKTMAQNMEIAKHIMSVIGES